MIVTMVNQILGFYSKSGPMTSVGKHASAVRKLPDDVKQLTEVVQGLVIHEYVSDSFYGFHVPDNRKDESHIRKSDKLLDGILTLDNRPLAEGRPPERRLIGVCHHFSVLLAALLRAKHIPARVRYGFGDYFNPGFYEDHSLCEYWSSKQKRWVLVDPQFDEVWRSALHINHDIFDVPREHFLSAGKAWIECRNNGLDSSKFGIFQGNMRGLWFIAGNLVKDVAALNKMEMLQWDAWGAMPRPNNKLQDKKKLKFFDRLSSLTQDPDSSFKQIHELYADKSKRLYVPDRVFNAIRGHLEWVQTSP